MMREKTGGQASLHLNFSHWEMMNGDMYDVTSKLNQTLVSLRIQQELSGEVPKLDTYLDK
jgi:elongation factor 2